MSPDPYDGSYDPSNPQSLNRYSYVHNNPLSFVDPLGLTEDSKDPNDANCEESYDSCTVNVDGGNDSGGGYGGGGYGGGGYGGGGGGVGGGSSTPAPTTAPSNAPKKTCIQQALMSTIPGLQDASQTVGARGPFNNYGHTNEIDTLTFSSPGAMYAFRGSTRLGLVPASVSELGYGQGVRLGNGLHVEFFGFPNGQFAVTSHLDLFNPNNGLGPLLGHFFVDVLFGHTKGWNSGALDRGCPVT